MFIKDQLNREIDIKSYPNKIISTVPSQTELLLDLNLNVIGRTKFCIHPSNKIKDIPKIGGTKNLNIQKIISLKPDIIIANKEENTQEQIEELIKYFPVFISDITNLESAMDMIYSVGLLTNKAEESELIINQIKHSFNIINRISSKKVCYLIWKNPYMSIGADTFIHDMIQKLGLDNICKNETRYPQISIDFMQSHKPDYIFLSSEPYPFKQKDIDELQSYLPDSKIILVDGEMFSWYGSRLLKSVEYFNSLIKDLKV
jgi:ABC-type Fe3+-hydroxamate transport system substrate-binding protein